jgi:hypothetical protein
MTLGAKELSRPISMDVMAGSDTPEMRSEPSRTDMPFVAWTSPFANHFSLVIYDALKQMAYDKDLILAALEPTTSALEQKMVDQALANLEMSFTTTSTGLEDVNAQIEELIAIL